jgi:hypothetical protein
MRFLIDLWEELLIPALLTVAIVCFVVAVMVGLLFPVWYFFLRDDRPTFELKKDDWSCTRVKEWESQHMVMVGKVAVPQVVTHNDCIQWSHK